MPAPANKMLDSLPPDALFEWYTDPRQTLESLSAMLGVSCDVIYRRLTRDAPKYADAQAIRARRLHELGVSAVYAAPQTIIDTAGNERIDPAYVALLKFRSDASARYAAILDRRLADRAQVEVTHEIGHLEQFFQRIAQSGGASVPIATAIEGQAVRVEDEEDAGGM